MTPVSASEGTDYINKISALKSVGLLHSVDVVVIEIVQGRIQDFLKSECGERGAGSSQKG